MNVGDYTGINYYVDYLSPIPKIGDKVNTTIKGYKLKVEILGYINVCWNEKGKLKVSCNTKILEVKTKLELV